MKHAICVNLSIMFEHEGPEPNDPPEVKDKYADDANAVLGALLDLLKANGCEMVAVSDSQVIPLPEFKAMAQLAAALGTGMLITSDGDEPDDITHPGAMQAPTTLQ